jgi:hypothetical protein
VFTIPAGGRVRKSWNFSEKSDDKYSNALNTNSTLEVCSWSLKLLNIQKGISPNPFHPISSQVEKCDKKVLINTNL